MGKIDNRAEKNREQKKGGKIKREVFTTGGRTCISKNSSREVFDAVKTNNSFTGIATIAAELTGK